MLENTLALAKYILDLANCLRLFLTNYFFFYTNVSITQIKYQYFHNDILFCYKNFQTTFVKVFLPPLADLHYLVMGGIYLGLPRKSPVNQSHIKGFIVRHFFIIDWFTDPLALLFGKLKKIKWKISVFYSLLS